MKLLFSKEEIYAIQEKWIKNNIKNPHKIYLFRYHIPNCKRVNNITTYTKIIYGVFDYNNSFLLSPIIEDTIENNISNQILSITTRDLIEYPWENIYHNKMVSYYTEILCKDNMNIKIKKYISFKKKFLNFFGKN